MLAIQVRIWYDTKEVIEMAYTKFEHTGDSDIELNSCILKRGFVPHDPWLHCHAFHELLFAISGKVYIENIPDTIVLEAPFLVIYRPYSFHTLEVQDNSDYIRYIFYFNAEDLASTVQFLPAFDKLCERNMMVFQIPKHDLAEWISLFHTLSIAHDRTSRRLLSACVLNKAMELPIIPISQRSMDTQSYITDVMYFISMHYTEPLNIDTIANHFSVSRSKLTRDFHHVTAQTIYKFILNLRLQQACEILRSGKNSTYTAMECGFSSNSCFIRAFTRQYGISPLKYAYMIRNKR